jgi:hypothetical protein
MVPRSEAFAAPDNVLQQFDGLCPFGGTGHNEVQITS